MTQAADGHPDLWRYHQLRAARAGVDKIEARDMYAAPGWRGEAELSLREGWRIVKAATAVIGPWYTDLLRDAEAHGWVRTASDPARLAWTRSCPGFPPAVRLRWQGHWSDVFVLAHELGHAVHRHRTEQRQCQLNCEIPPMLAEFPSILNELLVGRFLLGHADALVRSFAADHLIRVYIQNYYGAVAMLRFHAELRSMVTRGRPLNFSLISTSYAAVLDQLYGGAVAIDPAGAGFLWAANAQHARPGRWLRYLLGFRLAAPLDVAAYRDDFRTLLDSGSSVAAGDLVARCGIRLVADDQAAVIHQQFHDLTEMN